MAFYIQNGTFDALRDAALAIKALGRWDIVLDRCIECRNHARKTDETLASLIPHHQNDDFPFRWLFPEKGLDSLNFAQLKLLTSLRWRLFADFRRFLCPPDAWREMSIKQAQYVDRVKEMAYKTVPRLRSCVESFEKAKPQFVSTDIVHKLDNAIANCKNAIYILTSCRPCIDLESLQNSIDMIFEFDAQHVSKTTPVAERVLSQQSSKKTTTTRVMSPEKKKRHSPVEEEEKEEEEEGALLRLQAPPRKTQKTTKK